MNNVNTQIRIKKRSIPFRVSLIYAVFSALWIIFSDRILLIFIKDVEVMTTVQTVKGWFFILITTLLIFNLLRREVTKVNKLENELIRHEKNNTLRHLATGMAHRINNPLAGIVQNAQLIRNRLSLSQKGNEVAAEELSLTMENISAYAGKREIFRMLDSLISSGQEATEMMEGMLSFSASGSKEKEAVQIDELIHKTIEVLKNDSIYSDCHIDFQFDPQIPQIMCDPQRLQHAFFHLMTNGIDAMRAVGKRSEISINGQRNNNLLEIVFFDLGGGISEKDISHIFEPFYTTKENGRGLGLTLVQYIITEVHGGAITAQSSSGEGSRFLISLPL